MPSQTILAIDTTTAHCAACVWREGQVLASESIVPDPGHAEQLFAVIDRVLAQSNVSYRDLTRIVSSTGPGNFTGIRVGLAAARSLGMGLDIPVVGISNLEACAFFAGANSNSNHVLTILDARRGNAYFQLFGEKPNGEPQISDYDQISKYVYALNVKAPVFCGTGAARLFEKLEGEENIIVAHELPNAPIETIAEMGANAPLPYERISALYLRKPDARVQAGFAVAREVSRIS